MKLWPGTLPRLGRPPWESVDQAWHLQCMQLTINNHLICILWSSDFPRSLCFCFWVPIEILKLVYWKSIFWNIEWFLPDLAFYCSKSWKFVLSKWSTKGFKRSTILLYFKKVITLASRSDPKNFHIKPFLPKICFYVRISLAIV